MSRLFVVVAAVALVASASFFFSDPVEEKTDDIIFMRARPTYDKTQFAGKKVFVTGGSSGIGFGTALLFARFGADVVIVSRDSNPAWFTGAAAVEKIKADDIVKENKGNIRWYKADVADKKQIQELFTQLETKEKWIMDYAVNNAGIVGATGTMKDIVQYFGTEHDAIHNNLQGTINCLELEIDLWQRNKKDAAVVNLASVNGYRAAPRGALYAGSKFGILGLTRNVGVEYARGTPVIRVNAIAPGFTNTSLVWQQAKLIAGVANQTWEGEYVTPDSQLWKDNEDYFLSLCPTGAFAQPEDQANMIAFLLAKESALITGSIFTVDGMIGEK